MPSNSGFLFALTLALGCCGSATSTFGADLQSLTAAAERGDADSAFKLGQMYAEGTSIPRSYADAAKWYRVAAERWYGAAQNSLGILFATGQGVPQNVVYGLVWFRLASLTLGLGKEGDVARQNMKRLEQSMPADQYRRSVEVSVRCMQSQLKNCTDDQQSENSAAVASSKQPPYTYVNPAASNDHRLTRADYPSESVRNGEAGTVEVIHVVQEDGSSATCVVIHSSGKPRLDDAACKMVINRWKWKPATLDGQPIPAVMRSDVSFQLR